MRELSEQNVTVSLFKNSGKVYFTPECNLLQADGVGIGLTFKLYYSFYVYQWVKQTFFLILQTGDMQ